MSDHPINSINVLLLPAVFKVIERAQDTLKTLTGLNMKLQITVAEEKANYEDVIWLTLQQAIVSETNVPWSDLTTGSRKGKFPLYKKMYCYIGRVHIGGRSLTQMGEDLGMKNHSSARAAANDFKRILTLVNDNEHDEAVFLYNKIKKVLNIV